MQSDTAIGVRLTELRKKKGWTLRELERLTEKLGHRVTVGAIQSIEAGDKPNPTVRTMEALALALECKPGWLAFGE